MAIPKINSAHGSDTRNILNRAIDLINVQGKSIQDLVAKGQLTPSQYANLIQTVNGLISKGEITIDDLDKNNFKIDQTMVTNELLQQIAGTADINAVPADNSLTTRQYVDKSVTPEKTDFFNISKNKFNPSTAVDGKSIDTEGKIVDDSSRWLNDFIELPSSQKMSITQGSYRLAFYDSDKKFLWRTGITSSDLIDATFDSNNRFVRISGGLDKHKIMLNDGTTLLPFTEYKTVLKPEYSPEVDFKEIGNVEVHPSQEIHFKKSANIYNRFKLQKDKSLDDYGNVISETGRFLSERIILDPSKQLSTKKEDGYRYGIYDRNGNMIKRMNKVVGVELIIDIPSIPNAYSMLVSPVELMKDRIMINEGETALPYEDYGYTMISTPELPIRISENIIPKGSGESGGGGSDEPSFNLAGTSQIFESVSNVYSPSVLTDVYSTTNTSQIDYIEFSSNTLKAEIIVTYIDSTGAEKPYQIINTADFTNLPQTIGNIVEHGGVNTEFLQYDEGTNQYKISIKSLNFSNGFKVQIRNNDTSDKNIAVQLAGRYYV